MFNLDPGKLIVIAVVAIILLGPDKLPQFARQVGGAWRTFNDFRHRMESEVRSTMPDLPPTSEIARLARSPSALLTHLSNLPSEEEEAPDGSFQPPAGAAANGTGEGASDGTESAGGAHDESGASGTRGVDGAGGVEGVDGVDGVGVPPDGGVTGTAAPAANGKPAVAPQPADISVPADPTLN
ncbi:MAG TPA: twin-arginine translocase TatA/TatE family subunit [Acidimicrobiales bacterium]|nr:twin-arginine translocase TatA/TatE family subunit [Acidimicrobiales bacterium]